MPLRNEIAAIVAALPNQPITFYFGTYNEINGYMDKQPPEIPAICLYQSETIGLKLGVNGSVNDDYSIHMDFRAWSKFEKNTADDENIVNSMLLLAKKFLVNMSNYVAQGEHIRYFVFDKNTKSTAQPVYKQTDAGFCGVSLSIKAGMRQDPYLLDC